MKNVLIFFIFVAASSSLFGDCLAKAKATVLCPKEVRELLDAGNYKEAQNALQKLIQKNPTSEHYLLLAVSYLLDQQEEAAFITYVKCLDQAPKKTGQTISAKEKMASDELMALYVANNPEFEKRVEKVMQEHPDYSYCQFFFASSLANQHKFESFFYLFYNSYLSYPDSHMAHKTKGIVASLLFQRAKSLEEKETWRKKALEHFAKSMTLLPEDRALHKMMIYTAADSERQAVVHQVIDQICQANVKIPRGELAFYINHALWVNETLLAERLIDKAKSWYEYSRMLQEMQQLVETHKQKK